MGRKWGQHFLTSRRIAESILDSLRLWGDAYTWLIEVGPGKGILTEYLLREVQADPQKTLTLVEIDPQLCQYLQTRFPILKASSPQIQLIQADILRWFRQTILPSPQPLGFIGNLNYQITAPLFRLTVDIFPYCQEAVWMIQREVAERLVPTPGTSPRGTSLTVLLHNFYRLEKIGDVPPSAFRPPPQVWGSVIRWEVRERPVLPSVEVRWLEFITRECFKYRRKKLRNIFRKIFRFSPDPSSLPAHIRELLDLRPEQLSLTQWGQVLDLLKPHIQKMIQDIREK